MNINDITIEEIEETIKEVSKNYPDMFVKDLGNGLYKIGNLITNKEGLEIFNKALQKEFENITKND